MKKGLGIAAVAIVAAVLVAITPGYAKQVGFSEYTVLIIVVLAIVSAAIIYLIAKSKPLRPVEPGFERGGLGGLS